MLLGENCAWRKTCDAKKGILFWFAESGWDAIKGKCANYLVPWKMFIFHNAVSYIKQVWQLEMLTYK